MNLGMQLNMGMRLEQKLAPQMIQSLKLLQVNALQLEQLVKQEIETNPLLEMVEDMDESIEESKTRDDDDTEHEISVRDDQDSDMEKGILDATASSEVNWEEYFKEGFDPSFRQTEDLNRADPDDNYERTPTYSKTLQDHLLQQLRDRMHRDPAVVEVVEYLIDCVGDDGYLRSQGPLDLQSQLAVVPHIREHIAEAEDVLQGRITLEAAGQVVRESIHVLQSFDPAGVGARDLRECLLIQAWRTPNFPEPAIRMLLNHFPLFEALKFSQIAKAMGIENADVQVLIQAISRLNPKPGRLVSDDTSPAILPDLMVLETDKGLEVRLNDGSVPRLRISNVYARLLQQKGTRSDEKKFIKEKLNAANWLIKSIDQRKSTMLKVMTAILERQQDFFLRGPEFLKPMILQDIADQIGMHISTVNRVTNGKYVQTMHGIFELKEFFSAGVEQEDGSEVSSAQTKDSIRRLLEAEDPNKPLSDQQIVDALDKQGLRVARRTVSKYREAMNILPARLRRKF